VQGQQSSFRTAGLTEVLLPSGYRVRGVVPGLAGLAKRGLLDTRAQAAVVRLAAREFLEQAVEPQDDDIDDWQVAIDAFVAGFLREALDPGEDPETGTWKPTNLQPEELENIDQRDRTLLQMLVLRIQTAEDITASVKRGDWKLEGPGVLDSLADFRDQRRGAADRDDGKDVGREAVGLAAGGG